MQAGPVRGGGGGGGGGSSDGHDQIMIEFCSIIK